MIHHFRTSPPVARENSRHLATLPLVSQSNDVWETSTEIPYWWRVQYPDLGGASDWLNQISHAARPIRSTIQIWVVTRHRHGIFAGETGGSVAKCRLFSQATPPASSKNMHDLFLQFFLVLKSSRDQGATETEDKAHAKFLGGRLTVLPQSYAQMATYCEEQALSRSKMFQSRKLLKAHKGRFQMKESWKLYKIDKYVSLLCTKCSASKLAINVRYTIIIIHG